MAGLFLWGYVAQYPVMFISDYHSIGDQYFQACLQIKDQAGMPTGACILYTHFLWQSGRLQDILAVFKMTTI